MAKRVRQHRGWSPRDVDYRATDFDPYALAIGRLALVWNNFHERLAALFWTLLGAGFMDQPMAIWRSAKFDRPQREMLKAAAETLGSRVLADFPLAADDIKWLCDRCEDFVNIRNDAVHSPLFMSPNALRLLQRLPMVLPDTIFKNIRALRLEGKDLLSEFVWCYDSVITLRNFAVDTDRAMTAEAAPWPDRPSLPNRPHRNQRRTAQQKPKVQPEE